MEKKQSNQRLRISRKKLEQSIICKIFLDCYKVNKYDNKDKDIFNNNFQLESILYLY